MIISPICFAIAAMLWALASTLLFRFAWIKIKFIRNNEKFWNPAISAHNSKTIGGYKIDGFHITQSAAITFLDLGIVLHNPSPYWWIEFIALGLIWIGVFPFTYGRIAPKPKTPR